MSTIIRNLPCFLLNVINRRKIESPLRKIQYMVLDLNAGLQNGYYKIVSFEEFNAKQTFSITCRNDFLRPFDANNPFLAQIIINKELHKGGNRSCLHLEFDISNSKMDYEAGDYVAVFPKNYSSLVEQLGELTNTDLSEGISLSNKDNQTTSYHTALSHYVEITALPSPDVMMKLAEYCSNQNDKNKMTLMGTNSEEGKTLYKTFIEDARRNIVHILEDIKSCKPPLDQICRLLPRLQPRYYSISSSPKLFPESVHVTAVVVKYQTKSGRVNQGVTTAWLAGRQPASAEPLPTVPIYIRKSEFRLPASTKTPIIMVGTGTGLAPFRGFLQERAHARWNGGDVGETILYFGCRHRDQDFIYQEELEEYEKCGLLKLNLAFSRDQYQKVYVTHLLEKNLEQIWNILGNRNGHFYVCGNANNMAVDVRNIVLRAIREVGMKSDEDAIKFLNYLESIKKYCSDVWS
ncbi:NADPH--cytochrome P450 reductase-like isoform X2 [Plodia interpunctella]|uniref:NADPH--cytochrome P450 reductase-like isoform X2 n=1 Tax=Plodia interpunctella TaxID=58824 RepID=UPI0023683628|nr:NADPH--cytochrome P450 reductase-like isoform X2 [Plodia interpunctella]